MSNTIQKPLNCRNARCGATCSIMEAGMWSDNPSKCPGFEYNPYIYDKAHDAKVRAEGRAEIQSELMTEVAILNETKMTLGDLKCFAYRIKDIAERGTAQNAR